MVWIWFRWRLQPIQMLQMKANIASVLTAYIHTHTYQYIHNVCVCVCVCLVCSWSSFRLHLRNICVMRTHTRNKSAGCKQHQQWQQWRENQWYAMFSIYIYLLTHLIPYTKYVYMFVIQILCTPSTNWIHLFVLLSTLTSILIYRFENLYLELCWFFSCLPINLQLFCTIIYT